MLEACLILHLRAARRCLFSATSAELKMLRDQAIPSLVLCTRQVKFLVRVTNYSNLDFHVEGAFLLEMLASASFAAAAAHSIISPLTQGNPTDASCDNNEE